MSIATSESFLLGKFDDDTALVATPNSFVIRERVHTKTGKEMWANKYYYTEIGDAVRGYARLALRQKKRAAGLHGSLPRLIEIVNKLEGTIKTIGDRLAKALGERLKDPIEAHLFYSQKGK